MTAPNDNCLQGMRCPSCGNATELRIAVTGMATVTDDGIVLESDTEWDAGSFCECPVCDHYGIVHDFCERSGS